MSKPLLVAVIIESEAGWGAKPDGYLYATSRDLFEERKKIIQNGNNNKYGLYVQKEETVFVSEEDWKIIVNKGGSSWENKYFKPIQL